MVRSFFLLHVEILRFAWRNIFKLFYIWFWCGCVLSSDVDIHIHLPKIQINFYHLDEQPNREETSPRYVFPLNTLHINGKGDGKVVIKEVYVYVLNVHWNFRGKYSTHVLTIRPNPYSVSCNLPLIMYVILLHSDYRNWFIYCPTLPLKWHDDDMWSWIAVVFYLWSKFAPVFIEVRVIRLG